MKPSKEGEIKRIQEKFMIFYTYLKSKYSEIAFYDQMKEIVDGLVAGKNLQGLRHVEKELNGWLKEMEPEDVMQVNLLLQKEFGNDPLEGERTTQQLVLNQIVKRGVIKTKEEYEIVLQRVEEIHNDSSRKDEVNNLNLLLAAFHKSSG
jgi:hypothetical protein